MAKHAADTGEHCCETNDGVQCRNSLGQRGRCDSSSDNQTCDGSHSSQSSKLCKDVGCKTDCSQRGEDTTEDTEDAEEITASSCGLRSQTRQGSHAQNTADEVACLYETRHSCGSCGDVSTAEEGCRNRI